MSGRHGAGPIVSYAVRTAAQAYGTAGRWDYSPHRPVDLFPITNTAAGSSATVLSKWRFQVIDSQEIQNLLRAIAERRARQAAIDERLRQLEAMVRP